MSQASATFHSILFERPDDRKEEPSSGPRDFLVDLHLDQIFEAVQVDRQEYQLGPLFLATLNSTGAIEYRHQAMKELENQVLRDAVHTFALGMRSMRRARELSEKVHNKYNGQGWFLNCVEAYCDAVTRLGRDLAALDLKSRAFSSFREFLRGYLESQGFKDLLAETGKMRADLAASKYCLLMKANNQFTVRKYEGEEDYSVEVEKAFEKFKEGAVKDYRIRFSNLPEVNHVEEAALDFVAKLYPEVFQHLDEYCARHREFLDPTVAGFDREVQFYVAYHEFLAQFTGTGLRFCYPAVSDSKEVESHDGFDLALANKLVKENSPLVTNDFFLKGDERIFVVNGPNQGGKSTFARAFGQLHHLACLGLPVPGTSAKLFLFDRIFSHFEREENFDDLRSRLEDDLVRIHAILDSCTPKSIVIVNELFSSSTLQDAVFLGKKVLERIIQLDTLCIYVTFIDELSTLDKAVSVMSTVLPENPELRTFKITRRPADGLAFAMAIADKHQLSYERIKERIRQ